MDEKTGYPYQQPPPSYAAAQNIPQHQPLPQFQPLPQIQVTQPQFQQTMYGQPNLIINQVGPHPCMVTCPSCRQYNITRMEFEPSTKTHLMAALLCLFGCICCACIPYCVDSCMNGNHYCSNCGAYVGTFSS